MSAVSGIEAVASSLGLTTSPVTGAKTTDGSAFANSVTGAIDELRSLQSDSDALKVTAVTGDLDDIHAAMIASSRAAVTLELVAAVRNKGVDAFNEIMRMQA
ncbi:flagellar hook-basal body complex protein FliE [Microbacterium sp. SSW1-47]|uniref:flagellar hook-basal body complex protein FliE n=1 Tax=Microbacterium sufflavum TaxID=2851649 RepID=UPI001FFC4345|nr:flagellar hook-basal body complex protein FliE [Microbacterium sufflavum]MCK2026545.1 flagellar hook-basal body complex protein FliE [Microbacterium sufflavum]